MSVTLATDAPVGEEPLSPQDQAQIDRLFDYHQPTEPSVHYIRYFNHKLKRLAEHLVRTAGSSRETTRALNALHEARSAINYAVVANQEEASGE
jgi:plasmid stabilization system protein ParE